MNSTDDKKKKTWKKERKKCTFVNHIENDNLALRLKTLGQNNYRNTHTQTLLGDDIQKEIN